MLKNQKMSVDLRIVCGILLVLLAATIVMWKPWESESTRTITISGEASKKVEPDQYQFTPTYQQKGTDRATIQRELTDKVNGVVAKLKELGVEESNITLSSSTYDNIWNDGTNEVTSNTITILVSDKELSQKVQDYLATTSPEGQTSAYPTFSTEKRKQVEDELRTKAIADAKTKAEASLSELGAKLGKVITIDDQSGNMVFPMMGRAEIGAVNATDAISGETFTTASALPVLPGQQEITYSVNVTYQIK